MYIILTRKGKGERERKEGEAKKDILITTTNHTAYTLTLMNFINNTNQNSITLNIKTINYTRLYTTTQHSFHI